MTQQPKLFLLVALPANRKEKREATREVERVLSKLQPVLDSFEKELFKKDNEDFDFKTIFNYYNDLFNAKIQTIAPNSLKYIAINPYYFKQMFTDNKVDMNDLQKETKTSNFLSLTREIIRKFTFRHC